MQSAAHLLVVPNARGKPRRSAKHGGHPQAKLVGVGLTKQLGWWQMRRISSLNLFKWFNHGCTESKNYVQCWEMLLHKIRTWRFPVEIGAQGSFRNSRREPCRAGGLAHAAGRCRLSSSRRRSRPVREQLGLRIRLVPGRTVFCMNLQAMFGAFA